MTIRRISLVLAMLSVSWMAVAQDALKVLSGRLSSEVAVFDYSFVTSGSQTPFVGEGRAAVSGSCYSIVGNGLEIRCDGVTRWTADPEASEMVIEPADGQTLDFLSNPALLLSDIEANFKVESKTASGSSETYLLSALREPSVSSLSLTLVSGLPSAAELKMKDGSVVIFKVSSFSFTAAPGSVSGTATSSPAFFFSAAELAAYKNITDLR